MPPAPSRTQQFTTIVMMLVLLVSILTLRRSCATGTARLFEAVSVTSDGGAGRAADR